MPSARQQIAVGVIYNAARNRVLITRRPPQAVHGGLWEFPGGKLRANETAEDALRRELREELNLVIDHATPLIRLDHDYPEASVRLDVWSVDGWHGEITGREGQQIEWVSLGTLKQREFPKANRAIIESLQWPSLYLITPDLRDYDEDFFVLTRKLLGAGLRLLQFRSSRLDALDLGHIVPRLAAVCSEFNARLLLNSTPTDALKFGAHGVHLNSMRLLQLNQRPLDRRFVVAASCHNGVEIQHAARLGLDFSVIAPVRRTAGHPGAGAIGWRRFRRLARSSPIPVYALGGMRPRDVGVATRNGALGIAMISGVWAARDPAAAVSGCGRPGFSVS